MHSGLRFYFCILLFLSALIAAAQPDGIYTTPAEQGAYKGNRRVGPWQYFDRPGTVALTVNYDDNSIFFDRDTSDFFIQRNEKWVREKLQTPCRFHGSTVDLIDHYLRTTAVPFSLNSDAEPILTFVVNEEGIATNPEVVGDSLGELRKFILSAFKSAPNNWIVGVTNEGQAVKCKMAIAFSFHFSPLPSPKKPVDARLVAKVTRYLGRREVRKPPITFQNGSIRFSHNDSKIASRIMDGADVFFETPAMALSVTDLNTAQTEVLSYGSIFFFTWLDANRLIFNYNYKAWPTCAAVYHSDSKIISDRTDSTTLSHVVAPGRKRLAFTSRHDNTSSIWSTDLAFNQKELIAKEEGALLLPREWSQDEKKILCELNGNFNKWIILDIQTKERINIPLYDSEFLGWTSDGRFIYLRKNEQLDYDIQTEVFRFDIENNTLSSVFKRKNVYEMCYHSISDKLVSRYPSGKVYLSTMNNPEEDMFLFNHAVDLQLSNNGNLVAFINSKTHQLHVYDLIKKISYQVSSWRVKK
jgi:hypothetical protein